jgi:hypothetical protein
LKLFRDRKNKRENKKLSGDPNKATSLELIKVLNKKCPGCGNQLEDHLYALVASKIFSEKEDNNLDYFLELLESQKWEEITKYKEFDPIQDVVEVFFIKCVEGKKVIMLLLMDPFELYDAVKLLKTKVFNDLAFLQNNKTFSNLEWVGF